MKVIFTRDLKKVAKRGDIKEVKDGYAENFLIKNGFAVPLTEQNINKQKKENKEKELEEELLKKEASKVKENLEKNTLVFKVKTGEQDKVFGSISPKQIKEELTKKGFNIDKKQITLVTSLQSLGFHKVEINLYKDIKAELKIQLVKYR